MTPVIETKGLSKRYRIGSQTIDALSDLTVRIDAGEFVKHMQVMTDYLEAAAKGGETYSAIRDKERLKEQAEAEARAARAQDPKPQQ